LNNFIIFTLVYQLLVVIFYNKAAKLYTFVNKIVYLITLLFFVYLIKSDQMNSSFEIKYLVPIVLTSILFLIYDTNKGFAQHSLRNKFFPTLIAFVVLITHFITIDIVNYALILSASYDLLITTERKDIAGHKKFIGPIFILVTQLMGLLFNFGIDNDLIFITYWIVVAKLFPFSILKEKSTSIDEHYLSRSILILSLAFGHVSFSAISIALLAVVILLSLGFMYFLKHETQGLISYRSIILSSSILFCVISGKTTDAFLVTSILWIDFYFLALVFSRVSSALPERINQKLGSSLFYLLISGVLFGASHWIISENIKVLFLNGQINLAILLLVPFLLSGMFFFSKKSYSTYIKESIRKIDHFDTFISQLIIIIGVILSV